MGSEKLLFRLEQPHGAGDLYIAWQKGSGMYLATTGIDSIVNIFDKYGQIQDRVRLPSLCAGFQWDSDGDILAVICGSPQLTLWDANNFKKTLIDVRLKDQMSCLAWAKNRPVLAVGTVKGNVSIYNHNSSKRTPIIGKHTKKITCGAWNSEDLLALGSEDKTISISNLDGDTLKIVTLRSEPTELQFSSMKLDERTGGENTVSVIVGKRTLYLYNILDPENPIELAFQQSYGSIVTYNWYGDGYILIGFTAGNLIAISTHIKEVGQELFQVRNHKHALTDIAVSEIVGKVASCGDNTVKIHDLNNLQETSSVLTLSQESGLEHLAWSSDGQLLAVCTKGGSLNVYVAQVPLITSVCAPRLAILSSLTEISLYNYSSEEVKMKPIPITLESEPAFIGIGPYHIAAGMNNQLWFYDLTRPQPGTTDTPLLIKERQYLGTITSVKLNADYASVLFEGKIHLHTIEKPDLSQQDRESIMFPTTTNNTPDLFITSHAITMDFLIYGTDMGCIVYFLMEEWSQACEYKHPVGISNIFTDPPGTRLVFTDVKSHGYVYNSVTNETVPIPSLPNNIEGVVWDSNINDRNVFIIHDDREIITYIYKKLHVNGTCVDRIGTTSMLAQQMPLLMFAGEVLAASSGGQLIHLVLNTHDTNKPKTSERDQATLEVNLGKQIQLHRFQAAWITCELLKSEDHWRKLAVEAMQCLEIELAIRAYTLLEDVSMVWCLESLRDVEDTKLLCGYIAMYLGDFDRAQQWFLASDFPLAALEMRRDLLHWDQALQLAKKMAQEQVALISREYAQQLEFTGNYSEAYIHYDKGLQQDLSPDHTLLCRAGMARSALHCKNYRHGLSIVHEINDKALYKECAEILDKNKQLADAAALFEKCHCYDRAAANYIKLRNWTKIGELLPKITSTKIHLQYAIAKEQEGKYEDAVRAYYTAKDYDAVIRLQLEKLNNPEIAVELVQETKSVEGAKLVAKFFQKLNDYTSATKFLVLSKCNEEAFDMARKHGKMQLYGEVLLNTLTPDEMRPKDFSNIAMHFESERDNLLAGIYWFHAKEYTKAMSHLLRAAKENSKENEAITAAIDVVASSRDETLTKELIEFLLGESDGLPKEPKYLFRLYMAKKQFKEAAQSALIIANEEQVNGNYRNAHDVLFAMYQELKQNGMKIPEEMQFNLMLLHSYILVKIHVRRGDHLKGARMLIRVAENIDKFPAHIVPILTSTVIECHRAGLKQAAFKYATVLMKPDYRKQIDPKYAKKIETVVRKSSKRDSDGMGGDSPENITPCPYCNKLVPETDIHCDGCDKDIPFCIVTGRHLMKKDLTACPACDFPAFRTPFIEILQSEDSCPMCAEKLDPRKLVKIDNPDPYLNID